MARFYFCFSTFFHLFLFLSFILSSLPSFLHSHELPSPVMRALFKAQDPPPTSSGHTSPAPLPSPLHQGWSPAPFNTPCVSPFLCFWTCFSLISSISTFSSSLRSYLFFKSYLFYKVSLRSFLKILVIMKHCYCEYLLSNSSVLGYLHHII